MAVGTDTSEGRSWVKRIVTAVLVAGLAVAAITTLTVTTLKINDTGGNHTISIVASSDEADNRTLSIPALGGNKTLAAIEVASTWTAAQTFSATCLKLKDDTTGNAHAFGVTNNAASGGQTFYFPAPGASNKTVAVAELDNNFSVYQTMSGLMLGTGPILWGGNDVGVTRSAAGVLKVTNADTSAAFLLNASGRVYGNAVAASTMSTVACASNVVTVVTTAAHNLATGQIVTINAVDNTYDATAIVTVTNTTTFTYALTHGDEGAKTDAGSVTAMPVLQLGAAPTTPNALADVTIGCSATTQKGLVIQGKAVQTANLTEWQNSAGAALASVSAAGAIAAVGLTSSAALLPNANGTLNLGSTTAAWAVAYARSLITDAGQALALTATAPTAADASQAGVAASLTASAATAGTVTAGAAAGGNANITAGNAARLTSGNAAGGDVLVTPGAGIGTGAAGRLIVRQPGGVAATDDLSFYHDGTDGRIYPYSGGVYIHDVSGGAWYNGYRVLTPGTANVYTFGSTALEVLSGYFGESTATASASGLFLGLTQQWRFWTNSAQHASEATAPANALVLNEGTVPALCILGAAVSGFTAAADTIGNPLYLALQDAGAGATVGKAGATLYVTAGAGSAAGTATSAGGAGGGFSWTAGAGGVGLTSGTGGAGGAITIQGGAGAAGTATGVGGAGSVIAIYNGAGGATGGGGAGAAGQIRLAAAPTTAVATADVLISNTATSQIGLVLEGAGNTTGTEWWTSLRDSAGLELASIYRSSAAAYLKIGGVVSASSTFYLTTGGVMQTVATGGISWSSTGTYGSDDVSIGRSAAGVLKIANGSTGYGYIDSIDPYRYFSVAKTPGTATTLTAIGGTPAHTLQGTASNLSDSTGHYVQLSVDTGLAGIDIGTTEVLKTEIKPLATFVIKTGAVLPIAGERLWVGFSDGLLTTDDSPTGQHVMAFRYAPTVDGTAFWRCVTNDGGADTGTTTVTTTAIAVSTRYILTIDAVNPASIKFYVNGVLVATHATNLPTTTVALGTECFMDDAAGGSTKELSISKIEFRTY